MEKNQATSSRSISSIGLRKKCSIKSIKTATNITDQSTCDNLDKASQCVDRGRISNLTSPIYRGRKI